MNIFRKLANDPNVDPALRGLLGARLDKASPRRFTAEPITGFGSISDRGSERSREVRDEELAAQRDDERFERIWGSEE